MRNAAPLLLVLAAVIALLGTPRASASEAQPGYLLIVNPANARTSVDRKFVEDAFLKKLTTWADRVAVRPVDQSPSSPVRRRFSVDVLDRSVAQVRAYWQQRIFAGLDLPPAELDTDADVVRYVLKYEGAVGYVSQGTNLGACKAITLAP